MQVVRCCDEAKNDYEPVLTHMNQGTRARTHRGALWSVKLENREQSTEHCLVEKPEITNRTRRSFIPGDL